MYYEINVAKKDKDGNWRHYFATAKRSITTSSEAKILVAHFNEIFPKPTYKLDLTCWESTGRTININSLINS